MTHTSIDLIKLVDIPAGSFVTEDEKLVEIKVPFAIGKYPVTQLEWKFIIAATADMDREMMELNPDCSTHKGDDLPVHNVSWAEATEFCKRLTLFTGDHYRLPAENEWEYACRAGTTSKYNTGLDELRESDANFDDLIGKPTPVKQYPPNKWGLHDMHGNVWEWCLNDWDWESIGETVKVLRGGSWLNYPGVCRSAHRNRNYPDIRYVGNGFRVLRGGSWFSDPEYCRSADRFCVNPDNRYPYFGFRVVGGETQRVETNESDHFPPHYDARPANFEVVLADIGVDLEQFYFGSVIKYLYRYPYKGNAVKDLIKARSYLKLLIEVLEKSEQNSSKEVE